MSITVVQDNLKPISLSIGKAVEAIFALELRLLSLRLSLMLLAVVGRGQKGTGDER